MKNPLGMGTRFGRSSIKPRKKENQARRVNKKGGKKEGGGLSGYSYGVVTERGNGSLAELYIDKKGERHGRERNGGGWTSGINTPGIKPGTHGERDERRKNCGAITPNSTEESEVHRICEESTEIRTQSPGYKAEVGFPQKRSKAKPESRKRNHVTRVACLNVQYSRGQKEI